MADYKIELGVKLNTSGLKEDINKLNDKHKIKLGVDVGVGDIRKRISKYNQNTNNAKLKLGVKLDTSDLKKQINSLNLSGNGSKGASIQINTESLNKSLTEVKGLIAEIKNSLTSIDGGNTKSLITAVNQIADSLGRATDESETLIKTLNSISKKDFSVNFGIDLGNSKKSSLAYGREARKYIMPQLEAQVEYLENLLGGKNASVGKMFGAGISMEDMDKALSGFNSKTIIEKIESYEKYIGYLKKAASSLNIDMSGFDAQFSKSSEQLIDELTGVKQATDVAEDSASKFKKMFGSGIDSESLTRILNDLNEIKTSLQSLASNNAIDGLTQSFNTLSQTLDKLIANAGNIKGVLDNSFDGVKNNAKETTQAIKQTTDAIYSVGKSTDVSNVINDVKQIDVAVENSENSIESLSQALVTLGMKQGNIDEVTQEFQELDISIKKIKAEIGKDGSININVEGINKAEQTVKAIKSISADGESTNFKVTVTQDFKEVDKTFTSLKEKAKEISNLKIEIAGLDTTENANEIDVLTTKLNRLESEYNDLYSATAKDLNENQVKELGQIAEDTTAKVEDLREQLSGQQADTSAIDKQKQAYKDLQSIVKEIKKIAPQVAKLDIDTDANQFELLSNKLNELKSDYNTLKEAFKGQLSSNQFGDLQAELDETEFKISQVEAKIKDLNAARAKKIDGKTANGGTYAKQVDSIRREYESLTKATEESENAINELNQAFKAMQNASTDNEKIEAEKEYLRVLQQAEDQIKKNKQAEKDAYSDESLDLSKKQSLQKLNSLFDDGSEAAKKFGSEVQRLEKAINECGDAKSLRNINKEIDILSSKVKQSNAQTQTLSDRLKNQFSKYSSYLSVASLFMYAEQGLRDMFEQVKAIDSAMTELKKVTDETDASYNKFLTNAASRAKEIGTTIDGLVQSTGDFARLGYGFEDAQGLAEVANIYAVVGDEVEGVEGATQSLISTMAAFKDEMNGLSNTDFSMSIIDKMNEVGNNFAISSGGIGEALQRSASSMAAANNSLDETIALITAANTVVQNPEKIGNGLKTISMRIRGAKTELEEAGESTDGMAESTASLRAEIKALSGVDIMLDKNTFKSTYQIMEELSTKWEGLSDIAQANYNTCLSV